MAWPAPVPYRKFVESLVQSSKKPPDWHQFCEKKWVKVPGKHCKKIVEGSHKCLILVMQLKYMYGNMKFVAFHIFSSISLAGGYKNFKATFTQQYLVSILHQY